MADSNENLNINVNVDSSGAEAGSARAKTAIGGIGNEARQLDASFRRLMSAIDPTFQAYERFNQAQTEARTLWAANRISVDEFRAGMAAARTELQNSLTALEQNSVAARQAAAEAKRLAAEEVAAKRAAAREAVRAAAEAARAKRLQAIEERRAAREAAEELRRQGIEARSLARAEQELRSSIDPTYAAQLRYNETMRQATQLLMANKLQTGEFTRIQTRARQEMELNSRSLGRLNTGYVQLGYQAQDVVASLASGINPLVILAQQGGQTAAAMALMGGKMSSVAAFIAGPYGAAILGAIMVLGMFIPKLFDSADASDALKDAQERLADSVDSTTGRIKDQITWLERLSIARQTEAAQSALVADAEKGRANAVREAWKSVTPGSTVVGGLAIATPAQIGGRSGAQIRRWLDLVKAGKMETDQLINSVVKLGQTDKSVKALADKFVDLAGGQEGINARMRQADVLAAKQAQAEGKALTAAQRRILGIDDANRRLNSAELQALADRALATDKLEKAQAEFALVRAKADKERSANIAANMDETKANEIYINSIRGAKQEVDRLTQAKKDSKKSDSEARRSQREAEAERKRAIQERQRYELEDLDYQRELAQDNFTEQMRIQQEKIAKLKEFYGEDSRNYVQGLREKERMQRQHDQQMLQMARERLQLQSDLEQAQLESDNQIKQQGFGLGQDNLKFQKEVGAISPRQEIEARRAQLEEMYNMQVAHEEAMFQIKLRYLEQELALLPRESREYASMQNSIERVTAEHGMRLREMAAENFRQIGQINLEAAKNTFDNWKVATDSIAQSMGQMFQGIWMHSGNFRDNLLNIADQLVFKYVNMGLEMAANWAAQEMAKTSASVAGNAARTAAATTGATAQTAVSSAASTTEIGNSAAAAAAGAYKSTVVIPFIGPVAAPAAAALALAAVMGFTALLSARGGMGEVPEDGTLTQLHKKEMVLPAWIAEPLRQTLKSPRSMAPIASSAMQGGAFAREGQREAATNNFYYQPSHTNQDADLATLLRRDGSTFRKWLRNQSRNGAFRMGMDR